MKMFFWEQYEDEHLMKLFEMSPLEVPKINTCLLWNK